MSGDPNAELYLRATAKLASDFRARAGAANPVLYLLNGDIAGVSMWSIRDRGEGMWNFFAALTPDHDLIPGLGNHEGIDYEPEFGNDFYLQQSRRFLAAANSHRSAAYPPIRITVANLVPGASAGDLFQPFQDRVLAHGKRLRVIGLVLDTLLNESLHDANDPVQVWKSVDPMLEVAKRQLLQAADEGISIVVIQCHERMSKVTAFTEKLLEWKATEPRLAQLKLPIVFAAHDHKIAEKQIGETRIFDSGTEFTFTQAEIDDDGNFVQGGVVERALQKEIGRDQALSATEQQAVAAIQPEIAELERHYGRVLGSTDAYPEIRSNLEKGRSRLGIRLADGMKHWAEDSWSVLSADPALPPIEGAVSFYNSGTYRLVEPIQAGPLTYGHVIQMMPFQRSWGMVLWKGSDVQAVFASLRSSQARTNGLFTPQFSSNLRELAGHQLEILAQDGTWGALKPDAHYLVALEGWIDMNGYKLPEIDIALANGIRLKPPIQNAHEVMEKYFPAEFAKKNSCLDLLHP